MNVLLRPAMTRDDFLDWDGHQHSRWEFDGVKPVLMTGGSVNHSRIVGNILFALRRRLQDTPFAVLPEAGVATIEEIIRYPDALVAPAEQGTSSKLVSSPIVIVEVVSPSSGRLDRLVKLGEYRAVPTIRRYLVVEHTNIGVIAHHRSSIDAEWTATSLLAGDMVAFSEFGIEVPIAEFYEGTGIPETKPGEGR